MRRSIRVVRRIAFLTAVGVVQLTGCFGGPKDTSEQTESTGSVRLALQTTGPSGSVYRLRDAVFQITDVRTGELVDFVFGDEGFEFSPEITRDLARGDYTVTLVSGWFLERIGGTAPSPIPGTGGVTVGGAGGKGGVIVPPPLPFSPRPLPNDADFPFPGAAGAGSAFPRAGASAGGAPGAGAQPGMGGGFPAAGRGPGPNGGTGGFGSEVVQAQLISNAVQFFSIFGGDDVFVNYHFRVGGEIIDFSRGRLRIGISVEEAKEQCVPQPGGINPSRVMLEHNAEALGGISVLDAFSALATNEGHAADPLLLYQQLVDSYASQAQGRLPGAIHCGDEETNGVPTLNGFPINCDRRERFQFDNVGAWFATAFVNRIDLAPQNGAHCGQQRMIFANNAQGRMFLIFEAQIPNPAPELGLAGCAPLAEFWLAANEIGDPIQRGERLRAAFLTGTPELLAQGVGPFFSPSNHTIGSGTIRSNNFDQDPWTLREFKLALDGPALTVIPFPVGESPNGALWDETLALPQGAACREDFIRAAEGLLTDVPAEMSFVVDQACRNSESQNDFSEAYAFRISPGFAAELDQRFAPFGLSSTDLANRAQFAGSCIGCHMEASGASLGRGVRAPFSNDFVQVSEFASRCPDGVCFPISPALEETFLPRRLRALTDLLGIELPPDPCQGGGSGGGTGTGGFSGTAGFPGVGGEGDPGQGGRGGSFGEPGAAGAAGAFEEPSPPAPPVDIVLPQARTPVEELQTQDTEIREAYGERTLGGRDARVTH